MIRTASEGPDWLDQTRREGAREEEIVGVSLALTQATGIARRFAPTEMPILLIGETGTGKELLARAIHRWSGRSGPLVDLNCAALPPDLVEGELFGHTRGAFTGATHDRLGLVAASDRGTLFLDELGSLPPPVQAKFLRVLETGEVRRVGETFKRRVDFRVVAAAQPDLPSRARGGTFRLDLLYRLTGVVIKLAPLVERPSDILPLARHFAREHGSTLAPSAERMLLEHRWPGNVRELRAVIRRAVSLAVSGEIDFAALREGITLGGVLLPATANRDCGGERRALLASWIAAGWNADQMAAAVGVHRATIFRWLKANRLSLRLSGLNGATFPP
jgi:transcriptional regulator with PAS, ATPase and Fis domain